MPNETLWTGFNSQKLFAERARKDENGRTLTAIVSNVKSDWNAAAGADGEILNKPAQVTLSGDGTYITATEASGTVTVALDVHTADYTVIDFTP